MVRTNSKLTLMLSNWGHFQSAPARFQSIAQMLGLVHNPQYCVELRQMNIKVCLGSFEKGKEG